MSLTRQQMEFYQLCDRNDYLSPEQVEHHKGVLEQLGSDGHQTFSIALEKFLDDVCPKCDAKGLFKFHFMGQLKHRPGCEWSWYVGPGTYAAAQMSGVFRAGAEMGGGMMADAEKKQESGGCIYAIFGFIFGALFRLVFAVLMIPVQAVVSLTQRKPNDEGGSSNS